MKQFFKSAAVAAVGSLLLPASLWAAPQNPDTAVVRLVDVWVASPLQTASRVDSKELKSLSPMALTQLASVQPGFQIQSIANHTVKPVFRGMSGNRMLTVYQGMRYDNQQGGGDHGLDLPLLGVEQFRATTSLNWGTEGAAGTLILQDLPLFAGLDRRQETRLQLAGLNQPWGLEAGAEHQVTGAEVRNPYYLGGLFTQQGDYRDARGDTVHGTHARTASLRYLQGFAGKRWLTTVGLTHTDRFLGIPTTEESALPGHEAHDHEQNVQNTLATVQWQQRWLTRNAQRRTRWGLPVVQHQLGYLRANRLELGEEGRDHPELAFAIHSLQHQSQWEWSATGTQLIVHNQFRALQNNPEAHEQTYPNASIWSTAVVVNQRIVNNNRWLLDAATRLETGTFTLFGSQIRAEYQISERWTLSLELQEASRAPQIEERFADGLHVGVGRYEVGNPNLKEENGLHATAGIRQTFAYTPKFNGGFQAYAYAKSFRGYILTTPSDTSGTLKFYYGQDDALLLGADAQLFFNLRQSRTQSRTVDHRLQFNASALQGSRGSAWSQTSNPLPGMPPYRLTGTYSGTHHRHRAAYGAYWNMEAQAHSAQNRLSADEKQVWNATQTPGFLLVNAGAGWNFASNRMSLEFRVLNATNASYAHHLSYVRALGLHEPGRQYRLRLTFAL
jgi:iron complex outermembrane receptor protein